VNELAEQNKKLQTENERLEESTKKLAVVEGQLRELSVLQGQSIQTLMDQVKQFREVQEKVKESLQAKVVQNIMAVLFCADSDKDFVIDAEEVDTLKLRLKMIEGVDFSEENFTKALIKAGYDPNQVDVKKGGYSIQAVMEVLKNLMDADVPEEDNIFTIQPDKVMGGQSA
jgi:hypothetical protein